MPFNRYDGKKRGGIRGWYQSMFLNQMMTLKLLFSVNSHKTWFWQLNSSRSVALTRLLSSQIKYFSFSQASCDTRDITVKRLNLNECFVLFCFSPCNCTYIIFLCNGIRRVPVITQTHTHTYIILFIYLFFNAVIENNRKPISLNHSADKDRGFIIYNWKHLSRVDITSPSYSFHISQVH